ncbi:hypothetical protein B566_EDAN006719 [Ephemera danica]|nr:hypothetical protein B566_EDAN006719 [Ephemera danica]
MTRVLWFTRRYASYSEKIRGLKKQITVRLFLPLGHPPCQTRSQRDVAELVCVCVTETATTLHVLKQPRPPTDGGRRCTGAVAEKQNRNRETDEVRRFALVVTCVNSTHAVGIDNTTVEQKPSSGPGSSPKDPLDLSFTDAKAAFKSKTTWEILRAYIVYTLCSSEYLVENNMKKGITIEPLRLSGLLRWARSVPNGSEVAEMTG